MAFFIIENADNYSLVHSLFWHDYGTVEDFVSAKEEYYSYRKLHAKPVVG